MEGEIEDKNIELTHDFSHDKLIELSEEFFLFNPHLLKKYNIEDDFSILSDNELESLQESTNCRGCQDCEDNFTETIIDILDRRTK